MDAKRFLRKEAGTGSGSLGRNFYIIAPSEKGAWHEPCPETCKNPWFFEQMPRGIR